MLVPTRDRPDLLGFCLEGLARQSFHDVEVVVVDNPVEAPAQDVFERWREPGWSYVRAPEPLSMADNWELGIGRATGEFVAVVIDKWVVHPSALELANRALEDDPEADLVSWWSDDYKPIEEEHEVGEGMLPLTPVTHDPVRFDPAAELRKMYSFEQRRGLDRAHHHRGKICFGAFSQELLARMLAGAGGRIFHPLAPDYTSRVPALVLTCGAIDMGRPLLLAHSHQRSNGNRVSATPPFARSFLLESDPDALTRLPVPGLYASLHNIVAYDLAESARRLPPGSAPSLDERNLLLRAREDLDLIEWESDDERAEQYGILEAAESRLGMMYVPPVEPPPEPLPAEPEPLTQRLRGAGVRALGKIPVTERAARWALRRPVEPPPEPPPPPPTFASPVEAARAADELYTSVGGSTL